MKVVKMKHWTQGYTCAVANLIRQHGMCTQATDLWNCNTLSKDQLLSFEIDQNDIDILIEHWDELNHQALPNELKTPFDGQNSITSNQKL